MRDSTRRTGSAPWLALLLGLGLAGPVAGADGVVRVDAALFNKFASALQPLTYRREGWSDIQVPTFLGPVTVPVYCVVTATVSGIRLAVAPNSAVLSADVRGTMCGLPYSTSVVSPVAISIDPGAGALLVRPVGSMNVNARVTLLGVPFSVPLDGVRLASTLTVLSVPLDMGRIQIQSPSGPRTLTLLGRNQSVSLRSGYIEIQADVHLR